MGKPPGRTLPDLRDRGFASDGKRRRVEGIVGMPPADPQHRRFIERRRWLRDTPEGRAKSQATQDFLDAEAALARDGAECMSGRLLKGLPACVEPRSIRSRVPDPPRKRRGFRRPRGW